MVENTKNPIRIDLNEFKLHIHLKKVQLTLHFNSPSRRFYLSVIALVVNEMKRLGRITSVPLEGHFGLLVLLNETIGESAGSSHRENLLPRIYRKWKDVLPDLEDAPLFKVLGRRKEYDEGIGRTYPFTEVEKDNWANLFEYQGSEENVRLKFAIDRVGATLDDIVIVYENSLNGDAWERFISSLKEREGEKEKAEPDYRISKEPEVAVPPSERRRTLLPTRYRWAALLTVIAVVLGAIALAIWKAYLKPASGDVASIERMAFPLPDVPSIAVLPFVNMSGDPKQEFLCDGIAEEIITALSKVPRLFVISRQSTFFYKGKPVKVKQVSEELGVRYVLEGSVKRSGDRIRITTQLIDALTGRHLWAERYGRDLKDLFALQDEITIKILTAVQVKLTGGGHVGRPEKYYRGKQGLDCYLKLMEANGIRLRLNIQDINLARRMIEEAISLCPENPIAYAMLGWVYQNDYVVDNTKFPRETVEKGIELAQKALAIDDSIPSAHTLLSYFYMFTGKYDKAIAEGERAVALDPGGASALMTYGHSLHFAGKAEEAIPFLRKAIRLSPVGPSIYYFLFGYALMGTGRFEEAVLAFKKAIQRAPDYILPHIGLAATYSMMGRGKEAHAEAEEVLKINPKFLVDKFAKQFLLKDQSEMDKIVNALHKAGLK
jgi:adenylate cyclase